MARKEPTFDIEIPGRDVVLPESYDIAKGGRISRARLVELARTMHGLERVVLMRYDHEEDNLYFSSLPEQFDV